MHVHCSLSDNKQDNIKKFNFIRVFSNCKFPPRERVEVTLTFDALSNQAPHVIGTEVAPVRSFERVYL